MLTKLTCYHWKNCWVFLLIKPPRAHRLCWCLPLSFSGQKLFNLLRLVVQHYSRIVYKFVIFKSFYYITTTCLVAFRSRHDLDVKGRRLYRWINFSYNSSRREDLLIIQQHMLITRQVSWLNAVAVTLYWRWSVWFGGILNANFAWFKKFAAWNSVTRLCCLYLPRVFV